MGILCIIIGLYFFLKNDFYSIWRVYLFLVIAIPSNEFIDNILKIKIYEIDSKIILLLFLFLLILKNKNIFLQWKFVNLDYLFIIFVILSMIYSILGFINHNVFLYTDIKVIIKFIMLYIFTRYIFEFIGFKKIIRDLFIFTAIYSINVIFIQIFFIDQLPNIYGDLVSTWWGDRITFSNATALTLMIPLILQQLMVEKKRYLLLIGTLCLDIYAILLSQTRMLIVWLIINILIVCIVYFFQTLKRKYIYKKDINIFCGISFIILYLFIKIIIFGSDLIVDLEKRFFSGLDTLNVRDISNSMAFEKFRENPFGYGLGKEVTLYNIDFSTANIGVNIDSLFYTVLIKYGFLGFIWISLLILMLFIKGIRNLYSNSKMYLIIIIPELFILTMLLTAQFIYSDAVSTVSIILIIWILKNIKE